MIWYDIQWFNLPESVSGRSFQKPMAPPVKFDAKPILHGTIWNGIYWYYSIWDDMMWHMKTYNNQKWCSHYKLISSAKSVKILLRNWISEDQWTSFLTLHHSHKMNIKNRRWKWEKTNYEDYKDKVVSKHTQRYLKIKSNRKI